MGNERTSMVGLPVTQIFLYLLIIWLEDGLFPRGEDVQEH